jgi:transcriptional regulator with XRE-family HTH domain
MPDHAAAALGEIIRQQRELAEMSMRQFAEAVGISNPYLSQIERGLRAPSEQVLEGIARALETSAELLYERAGLAPPGEEQPEEGAVLAAIAADPRLSARQRSALREVYEAFVATSPQSRVRRRASGGGSAPSRRRAGADAAAAGSRRRARRGASAPSPTGRADGARSSSAAAAPRSSSAEGRAAT